MHNKLKLAAWGGFAAFMVVVAINAGVVIAEANQLAFNLSEMERADALRTVEEILWKYNQEGMEFMNSERTLYLANEYLDNTLLTITPAEKWVLANLKDNVLIEITGKVLVALSLPLLIMLELKG